MRVIGSPPDQRVADRQGSGPGGQVLAGPADSPVPGAAVTGRPGALPRRSRLSWPGWLDVAWVTLWLLGAMIATTFAAIAFDVSRGAQPADELTAVPLMAAMFWVMMWHGRRRLAAGAEYVRVSEENERLLATQRKFLQDASHQLRTPITIALGHSELLARNLASNRFATGSGRPGRRGTGLGLSLVRAVAAGHGGEVRVTSTLGAGSTFELLLPAVAESGPAVIGSAATGPGNVDGG